MAILNAVVSFPEEKNSYFTGMASLLSKFVFNVTQDFFAPKIMPVSISGTVPAGSTVNLFVNGINQSPVPDIVADSNGNWSGTITLSPGQNTIQVEFFPPTLNRTIETTFSPTLTVNNVLTHPTMFSPFATLNAIQMVTLDGNNLYIGTYIPPPTSTHTLYRYDVTTGTSIFLDENTGSPLSGRVYYMALDAGWLYVSQVMGDSSIKLSRYAKDLSARADITSYTTVPSTLYADGTNLWSVRTTTTPDVLLSEITPSTFTIIGSELSLSGGFGTGVSATNSAVGDDGTNLMVHYAQKTFGADIPGNSIYDGTPGLGSNLITAMTMLHAKVQKSTNTVMYQAPTAAYFNNPTESATTKNSLVYTGGYYYTVAPAANGKIIKLQDTGSALQPVDCIPLPFSTAGCDANSVPVMRLGPDGRLYVVSNAGMARWMPGTTSMATLARGIQSIDVTASNVAVVDDAVPVRALEAPSTIFTDRATTFNIPAPAIPTIIGCHVNITYSAGGVAWQPQSDGSAFTIERSRDSGPFTVVGQEYFGHGFFDLIGGSLNSGETLTYRVRAFNTTGQSAPSATATVSVPFLSPPYVAPSSLMVTSTGQTTVGLSWTNNDPGDYNVGVYQSTDNVHFTLITTLGFATTSYTVTGLTPGTLYYFYVTARTPGGIGHVESSPSNTVSDTTLVPLPAAPTGTAAATLWEGVNVTWTAGVGGGPLTGYVVQRSTNGGVGFSVLATLGVVTQYVDTDADNHSEVMYNVYATGPGGNSAPSANTSNISPVYPQIKFNNSTFVISSHDDGTYVYVVWQDPISGSYYATKILKSNSETQSSALIWTPTGSPTSVGGLFLVGGFLYAAVFYFPTYPNLTASVTLLKIDTSTMSVSASNAIGSFLVGNAFGGLQNSAVTDGTSYWLVGNDTIIKIDLSTLTIAQTGPSVGPNIVCATFMGSNIFIAYGSTVGRVDTSTLNTVETVGTPAAIVAMTNDGTYLYGMASSTVIKVSTGPLAVMAQSGTLGSNTAASIVASGGFLYAPQANGSTAGLMKLDTTPAFVSEIARTNISGPSGVVAMADATYVYFLIQNIGIDREAKTSF